MKYRIEISEESLRIIGLAVEEYMRIRMGQFETLSEDLVYEGKDRGKLYEDQYKFGVYNERSRSVEKMFNLGYQMAFPPFGNRERQHDSWGTCIDLVHAIEHQQWLDAPEDKKRHPAPHIALMGLSLWAGNRTRKSRGWTNELYVLCALHSSRPAHLAHRFARPDLQGAGIVQNWSGPHNFWDSCLSSNGKM